MSGLMGCDFWEAAPKLPSPLVQPGMGLLPPVPRNSWEASWPWASYFWALMAAFYSWHCHTELWALCSTRRLPCPSWPTSLPGFRFQGLPASSCASSSCS